MGKILAIKDYDGLCWNCLKTKNNIKKIEIPEMGYGSAFDGAGTELHLCEECYQKSNPEIWKLNIITDTDEEGHFVGEEYEFEKAICSYLRNLPLESQQFVFNEFEYGWNSDHKMNPQDWIDYQLGILPHEKCKEYGYYSPDEIKAYKERFPICEHPVNKVYYDGSCGSWCPYGAHGGKDQKTDLNISDACYLCEYFKERTTPRKEIKAKDWDDYCAYIKYNNQMDKLKEKFGK